MAGVLKGKAISKPAKVKIMAEAKTEEPVAKGPEEKKDYRINLALTHSIGLRIKDEAWKQHKSVNAYIEDIIIKHLNN